MLLATFKRINNEPEFKMNISIETLMKHIIDLHSKILLFLKI